MANSVDPDETPRSAASHLGLYCLLRPVCPNTYGKYGTFLELYNDCHFLIPLNRTVLLCVRRWLNGPVLLCVPRCLSSPVLVHRLFLVKTKFLTKI